MITGWYNDNQKLQKVARAYACKFCERSYKYSSGLSRHKKSCKKVAKKINIKEEKKKWEEKEKKLLEEKKELLKIIANLSENPNNNIINTTQNNNNIVFKKY